MSNPSGLPDPTAEQAIHNVTEQEKATRYLPKKLNKALKVNRDIFSLIGHDITSIKLKDRESGKEYIWDEWK